jgi:hypothetical protein
MEGGENKHCEQKRETLPKGGYRGAGEVYVPSPLLTCLAGGFCEVLLEKH